MGVSVQYRCELCGYECVANSGRRMCSRLIDGRGGVSVCGGKLTVIKVHDY